MSLTHRIGFVFGLAVSLSACMNVRFKRGDTYFSHQYSLGFAMPVRQAYREPAAADPADFQPPGGSMALSTREDYPIGFTLTAMLRKRLSERWYSGLSTEYFPFFVSQGEFCRFWCQRVRYTQVDWWDDVIAEDVVIKRTPSLGFLVGAYFSGSKAVIQYSPSLSLYWLDVRSFRGIDKAGAANESDIRATRTVASGAAFRQTLEIGSDAYRLALWFELEGANNSTAGLNIVFSGSIFSPDGWGAVVTEKINPAD